MNKEQLEQFMRNVCYNFARSILDNNQERGFYFSREEDMKEVRKVNTAAYLLEELGDTRSSELKIKVDELIKCSPELRILEEER